MRKQLCSAVSGVYRAGAPSLGRLRGFSQGPITQEADALAKEADIWLAMGESSFPLCRWAGSVLWRACGPWEWPLLW